MKPNKKRYWYCPRDWMGQRTGEWRAIDLTDEERANYRGFLYESEGEAMLAALS